MTALSAVGLAAGQGVFKEAASSCEKKMSTKSVTDFIMLIATRARAVLLRFGNACFLLSASQQCVMQMRTHISLQWHKLCN